MGLKMATIILESAKVIEACKNTIATIEAVRAKRDNRAITNRMAMKAFSFKRGFYNMNQEEAKQWINEQGSLSSWGWSYYAWGDLDHAKKLLLLAKQGDPVTLNEEDCQVIFK